MSAFNVVRVRIKLGHEDRFIEAHRNAKLDMGGFRRGVLIKTGERAYCIVGEWESMEAIEAARPSMTALLDQYRDALEDLEGGLGVTDPVSGECVLDITAPLSFLPASEAATGTPERHFELGGFS